MNYFLLINISLIMMFKYNYKIQLIKVYNNQLY